MSASAGPVHETAPIVPEILAEQPQLKSEEAPDPPNQEESDPHHNTGPKSSSNSETPLTAPAAPSTPESSSKVVKYAKILLSFAISQWFYIVLAALIAIASQYPNFARHGGTIRAEYTIGYGAVALIFLQNGISMKTRILISHLLDWRFHCVALSMQFLITPAFVYGICTGIHNLHNKNIDEWMLVGAVVTSTLPTTIASNVVMTRKAKGTVEKTLSGVFVGNLVGAFVSPLLVQMYFSASSWSFANPKNGTTFSVVYKHVMKQLGLSVFIPLFVGQCLLNLFPKKIPYYNAKFRLNYVGSICLELNLFASFSTAFYQKSFTSVPGASIILIFFFNVGLYVFFTLLTFCLVRSALVKRFVIDRAEYFQGGKVKPWVYRALAGLYFSKEDTIAALFVCPAKTAALGISLTTSQYGDHFAQLGKLLSALVLYQTEQVLIANCFVVFLRRWARKPQDNSEKVQPEGDHA